jgi:hypothetical protein
LRCHLKGIFKKDHRLKHQKGKESRQAAETGRCHCIEKSRQEPKIEKIEVMLVAAGAQVGEQELEVKNFRG